MGSPFIFNGKRSKSLAAQGPLLQTGTTLDNDGIKNYLTNPGGELGTTTGWSAFNTTFDATGVPQTITAGSTKLSIANVNTNVIRGSYSNQMNITTVASSAGHGIISDIFTVENEDLAKVLQTTFEYTFASGGTNCDVTGTSTSTFEFWVYNVGLAAWTQPAGYRSILQNSGFAKTSFTFQTDSSSASNKNQYRIAILIKNAPSAAAALNFEMTCGPQPIAYASMVSEWQTYTMTITGTTTNPTKAASPSIDLAKWRRVGDSIEVIYNYAGSGGTAGSGTYLFSLPSGISLDTTKLAANTGGINSTIGNSSVYDGVNTRVGSVLAYDSTHLAVASLSETQALSYISSTVAPLSNSVNYSFQAKLPVVGWGTNQILSSDADQRVVACSYYGSSSTINNTSPTVIFTTKDFDTHGAYNTSTGIFTAPIPGKYRISSGIRSGNVAWTANQAFVVSAVKAGSSSVSREMDTSRANTTATLTLEASGSTTFDLLAGDTLKINGYSDAATAANGSTTANWLSIERISGNSQILAADTVACRYYATIAESCANTGMVVLNFDTKDYDYTNSVTTGTGWLFTAPVSGLYSVSANIWCASAVWTAGQVAYPVLYKNPTFTASGSNQAISTGTRISDGQLFNPFNATLPMGLVFRDEVRLNAGDQICLTLSQNRTGGDIVLDTSFRRCNIEIRRVGN